MTSRPIHPKDNHDAISRSCAVSFRVRYYETDMMGITHHSNYLRWFEVARTEYLRQAGMPYRSLEEAGLACPVIGARCNYFHSSRYDDLITVRTWIKSYDGLRLTMAYHILDAGKLICDGETDHAFAYHGRIVSLSRSLPDIHARMAIALERGVPAGLASDRDETSRASDQDETSRDGPAPV